MTNEHPDAAESITITELYFGDSSGTEETEQGLTALREFRAFRDGGNPFPSYADEELEERWAQLASTTEAPAGEEPAGAADEAPQGDSLDDMPEDAAPGADSAHDQCQEADADGREPDGALADELNEVWFVPRNGTGWQQHQETWHERFELDLMTVDGSSAAVLEARASRAGNTARNRWFLQLKCATAVSDSPWNEDRDTPIRGWLQKLKRLWRTHAAEPELLFVIVLPCSMTFTAAARPALAWSSPPPPGDDTNVGGSTLPVPAAVLCVAPQEESQRFAGRADAAYLALPERLSPVRDHLPGLRAYWHSTLHQRLPERLKWPCRE
jgi:hypothetical protein